MSDNSDNSDNADFSAISQITGGDERAARRLKATIAVIMRRTDDPELRALGKDVLAGRENVRRFLTHPSLMSMAERNFAKLEEGVNRLSDDEREDVMSRVGEEQTPDEEIDELREPAGEPAVETTETSTDKPDKGGVW